MKEAIEVSKMLSGAQPVALVGMVVLAGFALAAFAIYAVLNVVNNRGKERR